MNRYAKIGFLCLSVSIFLVIFFHYFFFSPLGNLEADVNQPACCQTITGKIITPFPIQETEISLVSGETKLASANSSNENYSISFNQLTGENAFNLTFSPKYKDGAIVPLTYDIENIQCNDILTLDADFTKQIED